MAEPRQEPRLQQFVDSAALKLLQFAVTVIMVPVCAWSLNSLLDRLSKIEAYQAAQSTTSATFELRMQSVERTISEARATIALLNEKVVRQEYEIRRLDERSPSYGNNSEGNR